MINQSLKKRPKKLQRRRKKRRKLKTPHLKLPRNLHKQKCLQPQMRQHQILMWEKLKQIFKLNYKQKLMEELPNQIFLHPLTLMLFYHR